MVDLVIQLNAEEIIGVVDDEGVVDIEIDEMLLMFVDDVEEMEYRVI